MVTQARGAGGMAQAAMGEGKQIHSSSRSDMWVGWTHLLPDSMIQLLPGSFIHSTDCSGPTVSRALRIPRGTRPGS